MFDRDSAFSMPIRDPDNPTDESPLIQIVVIGDELLLFKESSIHRGLTADTIDPNKSDLTTRHSSEMLYSVGAANSFVARMILQFKDMIELLIPEIARQNELILHVWESNKLLLECEKAHYHIYKHTMDLLPKCDTIIQTYKSTPFVPALPQIPDLQTNVSYFLINGKRFLISAYKLLHLFYQMPMNEKQEAHFDAHRRWIKSKLGEDHPICKILTTDELWVRLISECSNAIRHDQPGLKVEVQNLTLNPGNKFSSAAWKYDLTKKGLTRQENYSDLVHDLGVLINNMLAFFEDILLHCLQNEVNGSFTIVRRANVDPKCPIVYEANWRDPT